MNSNISAIVDELKAMHRQPGGVAVREDDLQRWMDRTSLSRSALYDAIALEIADGFHIGELLFDFCDDVMNGLYSASTLLGDEQPEFFLDIFSAFDDGEYYHRDNKNSDPIEIYTRPAIERILAKSRHE